MPILLRVSQLVKKSRTKYRADHGVSEDKYIFFIDAGENVDKINFSFKKFKDGFNTFLAKDQINGINRDHFEIFVSLPSNEVIYKIQRNLQLPFEAN